MNSASTDLSSLWSALDERPTPAAYMDAARKLRACRSDLRPLRVGLLASYTVDPLVPYLEVEMARKGFAAEVYVAPFNSISQELLDPNSGVYRAQPELVFVASLLEDICPPLANDFLALESEAVRNHCEEIVSATAANLRNFRDKSQAAIVLHNFALPSRPPLGIYEVMAKDSQRETVRSLNTRLLTAARMLPGVFILDQEECCAKVGAAQWRDDKMWYLGRSALSVQALAALARVQAHYAQALFSPPRKCLVLDLDDTLWGGVVGELGLKGIKLGQTYPGNVFRDFQRALLQLAQRGVLLAINSKNNAADAEEIFRSHPDMILKLDHFAARRINWQPKPENMAEIAKELNIGLDSLVFFDDNPVERELMRKTLPQVLTLDVPADPMKYLGVLDASRPFDRLAYTKEDRNRLKMYQAQQERQQLQTSTGSLEDFLQGLQVTADIRQIDDFAFDRVVELLNKTNQFNLTTRRHTASQLAEMRANSAWGIFTLQSHDRFGDNGIVAVAIVQQQNQVAKLDTFLMSCRVIGRALETALLAFLANWLKKAGCKTLQAEFIKTAKNAPAADFLPKHGFTRVSGDEEKSSWELSLATAAVQWPTHIKGENNG